MSDAFDDTTITRQIRAGTATSNANTPEVDVAINITHRDTDVAIELADAIADAVHEVIER